MLLVSSKYSISNSYFFNKCEKWLITNNGPWLINYPIFEEICKTRNTGRYAPLFLVLALRAKRSLGPSGPGWELCDIHTSQHWSKKNISIIHMCHMPPKRIFKKSQNFEFFQKRGVRRSKNDFFKSLFWGHVKLV